MPINKEKEILSHTCTRFLNSYLATENVQHLGEKSVINIKPFANFILSVFVKCCIWTKLL